MRIAKVDMGSVINALVETEQLTLEPSEKVVNTARYTPRWEGDFLVFHIDNRVEPTGEE